MEPRRTPALAPIALRVADDLRIEIETGRLAPGDSLPTLHEITQWWNCSITSARSAVALLKQQGTLAPHPEKTRRGRRLAEADPNAPRDGSASPPPSPAEPAGPELGTLF